MLNKFGLTYEEVEKYLHSLPKIKLEREDEIVGLHGTALSFIKEFFSDYNRHRRTILENGFGFCQVGRRRSIVDIYRLCNRYVGSSLEEVYDSLFQWFKEYNQEGASFSTKPFSTVCAQINMRVWFLAMSSAERTIYGFHDELGMDISNVKTNTSSNQKYDIGYESNIKYLVGQDVV